MGMRGNLLGNRLFGLQTLAAHDFPF